MAGSRLAGPAVDGGSHRRLRAAWRRRRRRTRRVPHRGHQLPDVHLAAAARVRRDRRARRLLDDRSAAVNARGRAMISVERVSFAYRKTPVLTDVSFTLADHARVGILGPNGSGKTT